jgi:hypothetical protein
VQLIGSDQHIGFTQPLDGLHLTLPAAAPSTEAAYVFRIATHCGSAPHS